MNPNPPVYLRSVWNWETPLHVFFWIFYFTSLNVDWQSHWFDIAARPKPPNPLTALYFPIFFYLNTYLLIPKFLKERNWFWYFLIAIPIALSAELARSIAIILYESKSISQATLRAEVFARDSFLFGWISITWVTLLFSFGYRFTKDWTRNKYLIRKLERENREINSQITGREVYKEDLQAKKGQESYLIQVSTISYFEAMGDFVYAIDEFGKKHILNSTLGGLEQQLNPGDFFRISRSEIVNKKYVGEYKPYIKNRLTISLKQPSVVLHTSNSRTPAFRQWMNA